MKPICHNRPTVGAIVRPVRDAFGRRAETRRRATYIVCTNLFFHFCLQRNWKFCRTIILQGWVSSVVSNFKHGIIFKRFELEGWNSVWCFFMTWHGIKIRNKNWTPPTNRCDHWNESTVYLSRRYHAISHSKWSLSLALGLYSLLHRSLAFFDLSDPKASAGAPWR